MMRWFRNSLFLAGVLVAGWGLSAAEPPTPKAPPADAGAPDLAEFRTVDKAITTHISRAEPAATTPKQPAYLGVQVDADKQGRLVIAQVEAESPAARAGVQTGDVVRQAAGQPVPDGTHLRDLLQSQAPGEAFKLSLLRKDKTVEVSVTLDATSHPMNGPRAILGVQLDIDPKGVRIDAITPKSPAEEAGLKKDDLILKADGETINDLTRLRQVLEGKRPGETVALVYKRDGKEKEVTARLMADQSTRDFRRVDRGLTLWKKEVYRLAVVPVEYPDTKHNDKVALKDWEKALFSKGTYTGKSPTGQTVYGSLDDYYLEQSCGQFHVEGKVFPWVEVGKKRAEYNSGNNSNALYSDALDALLERDGKDALKDFDGIFFLYAGARLRTTRGGVYWPHRASLRYKGQRWAYFICPEGGERMSSISVVAHEFGHMLGLPDLYNQPDDPGSTGLGIWCTMSTGHGEDGKPLHFCAWCKEQLGWLKPAVIDPTVKQKLILAPVENAPKECFKVLLQPDGSEYLLLENRVRKNFDRDLPGEGLLIWRVVDGKPVLEESHGIGGPEGPNRFLGSVPYPSKANHAFTPTTTPSSKSIKGGGLPVYITNIHRLPDGRITFFIGYEFL